MKKSVKLRLKKSLLVDNRGKGKVIALDSEEGTYYELPELEGKIVAQLAEAQELSREDLLKKIPTKKREKSQKVEEALQRLLDSGIMKEKGRTNKASKNKQIAAAIALGTLSLGGGMTIMPGQAAAIRWNGYGSCANCTSILLASCTGGGAFCMNPWGFFTCTDTCS